MSSEKTLSNVCKSVRLTLMEVKWSEVKFGVRRRRSQVTDHIPQGRKLEPRAAKHSQRHNLNTFNQLNNKTTCVMKRIINYFHDISTGRIPLILCLLSWSVSMTELGLLYVASGAQCGEWFTSFTHWSSVWMQNVKAGISHTKYLDWWL